MKNLVELARKFVLRDQTLGRKKKKSRKHPRDHLSLPQGGRLLLCFSEAGRSGHRSQVQAGLGLPDAQLWTDRPGEAGGVSAGARRNQHHERTGTNPLAPHPHLLSAGTGREQLAGHRLPLLITNNNIKIIIMPPPPFFSPFSVLDFFLVL